MQKIEVVTTVEPTLCIRVNMAKEEIYFEFLNAETPARLALLVMGCEMAILKMINGSVEDMNELKPSA